MDLDTKEIVVLYEHNSQIVLLEIFDKKIEANRQRSNSDKDEFILEETKSNEDKKNKIDSSNNIDDLMIVTADHSETLVSFTNREPMKRVSLRK